MRMFRSSGCLIVHRFGSVLSRKMRSCAEVGEAISGRSRSIVVRGPPHVRAESVTYTARWRGNSRKQPTAAGAEAVQRQDFDRDASNDTAGDATMSLFTTEKLFASSILVGMMAAAPVPQAVAQQKAAPPDFSSDNVGWVGLTAVAPSTNPFPTLFRLSARIRRVPSFPMAWDGSRHFGSRI